MYLILFTLDKNTSILANICAYTSFFRQKIAIEKVTPLILRAVKPKQRKNGIFRVCPELNLALSDNPEIL